MELTKADKDYIKTNLKWQFNWTDFLGRYFILIGPLAILFIGGSMFFGGFKFGHIYQNNFNNSFFIAATTITLLGLLSVYFTITRIESERKFKRLILPSTFSFDDISEKAKYLEWDVVTNKSDIIECMTSISLFSWGEFVTIIKAADNSILINSRPAGLQPFTINRDKVNLKKLQKALT